MNAMRLLGLLLVVCSVYSSDARWILAIKEAPASSFSLNSNVGEVDIGKRKASVVNFAAKIFSSIQGDGRSVSDEEFASQVKAFLGTRNLPVDNATAEQFDRELSSMCPMVIDMIAKNSSKWRELEVLQGKCVRAYEEAINALDDYLARISYRMKGDDVAVFGPVKSDLVVIIDPVDASMGLKWLVEARKDFDAGGVMAVPRGAQGKCNRGLLAHTAFRYRLRGEISRCFGEFLFSCDNYLIGRCGLAALSRVKDVRGGGEAVGLAMKEVVKALRSSEGQVAQWEVRDGDVPAVVDVIQRYIVNQDDLARARLANFSASHREN